MPGYYAGTPEAWEIAAEYIPKPWPEECAVNDLRWWADALKMGRLKSWPMQRQLEVRWGWGWRRVWNLVNAVDTWADPRMLDFCRSTVEKAKSRGKAACSCAGGGAGAGQERGSAERLNADYQSETGQERGSPGANARVPFNTQHPAHPPKPPQGGAPQDSGRSRGRRRRGGTSVVKPEPPPWTRDKDARSFDFRFMLDNSPGVLTQEQLNGAYAYAHEHGYPLPVYPAHIWESSGLVCPDAQPAQPANVIAFPGR